MQTLKTGDGWIKDKNGNLMMWVPDEYRDSVLQQGMYEFLGSEGLTVDFNKASHGTEWAKCYQRPACMGS